MQAHKPSQLQSVYPSRAWPLHEVTATRALEAAAQAALPEHTLMQRAGLAVARLALAVAPQARTIWIACGPGNNGGDGLEAALHLRTWGGNAIVTWLGDEATVPPDARASLVRAREAGVPFADASPPDMTASDLCIDALLGIGSSRAAAGRLAACITELNASPAPVLAVDVPSGLNPDTGHAAGPTIQARWTLSLLTLKPGLFTASGRDAAGAVWLDTLAIDTAGAPPCAHLAGAPVARARPHASHKGSYGDVAVIGGAPGMAGAALLAARAALHGGAGRVFVGLLDGAVATHDAAQPELMLRPWDSLDLDTATVVCGCGGGQAVREVLPAVLSRARRLTLDADALNAISDDASLQVLLRSRAQRHPGSTVITPHPLEAARLLGCDTAAVQVDRLKAARRLSQQFGCTVVLKGSGSVIASAEAPALINPTGNSRLATAGTGDVLAGLIGALQASGMNAVDAAATAAWRHGHAADEWPAALPLTAGALAAKL